MSGPVASNSLLFNLGMRFPIITAAITAAATAGIFSPPLEVPSSRTTLAAISAPVEVADNTPEAPAVSVATAPVKPTVSDQLPILTKQIAG